MTPAEKFETALESAALKMRGTRITKEEFEKLKELWQNIERNVLFPAAMYDISEKKND